MAAPFIPGVFPQFGSNAKGGSVFDATYPPKWVIIARQLTKLHCEYFREYFDALRARTIVVERGYVDRDFLEDFAAYYVRCFPSYRKTCTRLHFFARPFSLRAFRRLVRGELAPLTITQLQQDYLGFVVVKPLPRTVIGRTCLRTYAHANGRRQFPATRDYEPNLFGVPLKVSTLAFQEQDSVVAACATSALWSAFQSTGRLFNHPIPSPVEITKAATRGLALASRVFPNHGLTVEEMAHAIQDVGLDALPVNVYDDATLTSTLYAYLMAEIPVVLGVSLYSTEAAGPARHIDDHAVTVTGFSLGKTCPAPMNGLLLEAGRIDKIYVHDDQVGPFSRMVLDGQKVIVPQTLGAAAEERDSLHTSWRCLSLTTGAPAPCRAVPFLALLALYHKIRIPFQVILDEVWRLDAILRGFEVTSEPLCWDVRLMRLNALRTEILSGTSLDPSQRQSVLARSLPRFVWRATARSGGAPMLDVIFDATDVEQGSLVLTCLEYDTTLGDAIRLIAGIPGLDWAQIGSRVMDWYRS